MELDKAGRGSECDQGGGWLPEYRVLACVCVRQNMPGQVKKSLQKELHNKLMENRCSASLQTGSAIKLTSVWCTRCAPGP